MVPCYHKHTQLPNLLNMTTRMEAASAACIQIGFTRPNMQCALTLNVLRWKRGIYWCFIIMLSENVDHVVLVVMLPLRIEGSNSNIIQHIGYNFYLNAPRSGNNTAIWKKLTSAHTHKPTFALKFNKYLSKYLNFRKHPTLERCPDVMLQDHNKRFREYKVLGSEQQERCCCHQPPAHCHHRELYSAHRPLLYTCTPVQHCTLDTNCPAPRFGSSPPFTRPRQTLNGNGK